MIEPQGWIKLHRKLLDHPLFCDPQAFALWVQLLLRANHKNARVMIGNTFVDIKRGQLLTGRNKLSDHTGINRSKLERLLNLLESEHQIEQQKTTKYRLISISNYDKYQGDEQQLSIKRATTEQQLSTNKNDNNVNNENNIYLLCTAKQVFNIDLESDYFINLVKAYPRVTVKQELLKMSVWLESNPKKRKTIKGIDRFITNWLSKADGKHTFDNSIPFDQIEASYNKHFADALNISHVEELTAARKDAITKIWNRKPNDKEKPTNTLDHFDRYFSYCSGIEAIAATVNGYAPTIDRLLKYENYIKAIEGGYKCQN